MITFLMRNKRTRRAVRMRAWVGLGMIAVGLAFLTLHLRDSFLSSAGSERSFLARAEQH